MSKVILKTERLILRELVPSDADDLALILCDPETMRYYPRPLERQEVDDWIDRRIMQYKNDGHGLWGVILKSEQKLIGDCGLLFQDVNGIDELEVGYQFNKNYWSRGLATEAARGCMGYAFKELGAHKIISMIRPENIPSRRVAEKNGLRIEKEIFWRDFDHYVYAIERDDWERLPPSIIS
jgi:[ribosomal protein S5]-alanine N-acetyltransferase